MPLPRSPSPAGRPPTTSPRGKEELVLSILVEAGRPLEALEVVRIIRGRVETEFGAGAACTALESLVEAEVVTRVTTRGRTAFTAVADVLPEKPPPKPAPRSPWFDGKVMGARGYKGGTYEKSTQARAQAQRKRRRE